MAVLEANEKLLPTQGIFLATASSGGDICAQSDGYLEARSRWCSLLTLLQQENLYSETAAMFVWAKLG